MKVDSGKDGIMKKWEKREEWHARGMLGKAYIQDSALCREEGTAQTLHPCLVKH